MWSGRKCHPEDLRDCELTGVAIYSEYITAQPPFRLETLLNLLSGIRKKSDKTELWPVIENYVLTLLKGGSCRVENAELSPGGANIAVVLEARRWMGLKVRHVGLIYSLQDKVNIGHLVTGKRGDKGWIQS